MRPHDGFEAYGSRKAKVLELGCSMAETSSTQALYYPDAEFVGIDLSGRQVAQGNAIIEKWAWKMCVWKKRYFDRR